MKSNNPVFNNSPAFNGQGGYPAPQGQGYAYPAPGQQPYADPSSWGTGTPGAPTQAPRSMTIDDVVQKTGVSLGVVILAALVTWIVTPPVSSPDSIAALGAVTMIGMFAGLGIGLYATFSRKLLSPAVVLAYAAAQGVFMGGISKTYEAMYGGGLILNAVLGTIAACAGVLGAYKFFDINIGDKFRRGFFAAAMGFFGLLMTGFVMSMFGFDIGLFGNGPMGLLIAVAGLGFGIVGLMLDFDMIENAIRFGSESRFAWTAAFGLTASIVMVYFYILRILAILQSD